MPDSIAIYKLKPNLYTEGCPLVIRIGVLTQNLEAGIFTAAISFLNITDRAIASVHADIHFFDEAGIELKVVRDYLFLGGGAKRNSSFGDSMYVAIGVSTARSFSVAIREVAFLDETFWTGSADPLSKTIPARKTLEDAFGNTDTVRRLAWVFSSSIAKDPEVTARFIPTEYKDLWLCACGGVNHTYEKDCFHCGASYSLQVTHINSQHTPAPKPAPPLDDSVIATRPAVTQSSTPPQPVRKTAVAVAVKENVPEPRLPEQLQEKNASVIAKRRPRMVLAIGIPLLLAAGVGLTLLFTQLLPRNSYNQADAFMREGRYDDAISAFSTLGNYGDSAKQLLEAKYQKAESLLDAKDYTAAIALYKAIEGERDVADRIAEAKYRHASALADEDNFVEALALYTEVSDYRDSKAQLQNCHFQLAKLEIESNDSPSEALNLYLKDLSPTDSLSLQQLLLAKGSALYKAGKATEAGAYFLLITNDEIRQNTNKVYYEEAMRLLELNELDAAAELFNTIPDYEDSRTQLLQINYLKAVTRFDSGDYSGAAEGFLALGDYSDSAVRANESFYQQGVQQLDSGNYTDAAKTFSSLGDYSDAANRAGEASYQLGLQQLSSGDVVASYNTLYAIKWYDPAYYLLVTNSQYYIDVYDPGIGPNPMDEQ